ncbi:MAG: peptidase U32 family protein [Bacilli bacterium]
MELLVTPRTVEDFAPLKEAGASAIIIGEKTFGLRLAGEFPASELAAAVAAAKKEQLKVYIAVNALYHNEHIEDLTEYMRFVGTLPVDALVFGDPGVLIIARDVCPHLALHWNTETTATNWFTCNYWGQKGAKRAVLAREINLDAIVEMKEHVTVELEVQIHGMTCMFQSKRSIVGNYMRYAGEGSQADVLKFAPNLVLHDTERNSRYPIFEDDNGTHIMSPNDICMIDDLEELVDANIESFKIDSVLHSSEYSIAVTKLYAEALQLCANDREAYEAKKADFVAQIEKIQPSNRPLDTGFFYKETVY